MASRQDDTLTSILLDSIERIVVMGLYAWLCGRFIMDFIATRHPVLPLLLLSEGIVVVFLLLRRRSTSISMRWSDWAVALGGTCAPLLAQPGGGVTLVPYWLSIFLLAMGALIQISAKLTLWRGFGVVAANRGIKSGGPYRALRHPMYAGYMISQIGFFLANASVWNAAVYLAGFSFQIFRILAEERLLTEDPAYRHLMKHVPYRLIPGVF